MMKAVKRFVLMAALMIVGTFAVSAQRQDNDNKQRPPKPDVKIQPQDKNKPRDNDRPKDNNNNSPKKPQYALLVSIRSDVSDV